MSRIRPAKRSDVDWTLSGSITFTVAGAPKGQGRARHSSTPMGPRTYTPAETRRAAAGILAAWLGAGAARVPTGVAFSIEVEARMLRPASHTRRDGSPTRAWRAVPRTPDVDNILKLVLDALQPSCITDDALCSHASVTKAYAPTEETRVTIRYPA